MDERVDKSVNEKLYKTVINGTNLSQTILGRQQTEAFIDLVVDESKLLKAVRNVKRDHPSGQINLLTFTEPVTEDAALTHSERAPSESVVNYDSKKTRSTFDLTSDFMEDVRASSPQEVQRNIAKMFAKQIANDHEQLAIEGNDTIATSVTASDRLLKTNDGIITILDDGIAAGQVIDAEGKNLSKKLFYDTMRVLPSKYKRNRNALRWLVSPAGWEKWMYDVSDRNTALGDRAVAGNAPPPFGIQLFDVALMPEDLSYGTIASDCSRLILIDPQNIIFFVQRQITWEWMRQPRADTWEATVHMRSDIVLENINAVAMAKNISISGSDYTG